ncbi:MAG TPA: hypothetical protein VMT24_12370 [Aggregatilineaceae bacterium]|nr:hypothetical protein [Aggregatilineaceae bacterium]
MTTRARTAICAVGMRDPDQFPGSRSSQGRVIHVDQTPSLPYNRVWFATARELGKAVCEAGGGALKVQVSQTWLTLLREGVL